jgi:hypothetical protein
MGTYPRPFSAPSNTQLGRNTSISVKKKRGCEPVFEPGIAGTGMSSALVSEFAKVVPGALKKFNKFAAAGAPAITPAAITMYGDELNAPAIRPAMEMLNGKLNVFQPLRNMGHMVKAMEPVVVAKFWFSAIPLPLIG